MAVQEAGRAWGHRAALAWGRAARGARRALAPIGTLVAGSSGVRAQSEPATLGVNLTQTFDTEGFVALSVLIALGVFSSVTALLYVRERDRWHARAGDYDRELARLRGEADRADVLLAADPQMIVTWAGA